MTDRDTFAASALTGLLVNGPFNTDAVPRLAYSMADAMLRERERATEPLAENKRAEVLLTDEEREAIEDAIKTVSESLDLMNGEDSFTTATLRNLLERLHT